MKRAPATAALLLSLAGSAQGQDPRPSFAAPFLPPGHWAVEAVRRLDAIGLVEPGFNRLARSPSRRAVMRALRDAAARAEREAPGLAALTRAYHARIVEEFPSTAARFEGAERRRAGFGSGFLIGGYEVREGRLLSGFGYENGDDWTGPVPLHDVAAVLAGGGWGTTLGSSLAVSVSSVRQAGDWGLDAGYATAVWRRAGLWLGRRALGFGPGTGGGIAVNPSVAFDGGGIYLADPMHLPGFLRGLGPVVFETFLTRVGDSGSIENPWMWVAHGAVEPHPRVGIGLNRAAMFGGEGENGLSLRNLAYLLVGKHGGAGSGFDNQIFAIDVWYRPSLAGLPVILFLEWGIEDSAGAIADVPGVVAGLELAAVPGVPELALGVERASFAGRCCGNPIWYRHWKFDSGWTVGGVPLGHPLGGHGTEWLAFARADLLEARLRIDGRAFRRDRGAENLFAPDRLGRSTGARIRTEFRALARVEFVLHGALESGEGGWRESSVMVGLRMLY